jgi:hypothetical protein
MPVIIDEDSRPATRKLVKVAFVLESAAFPPLPAAANSVESTAISATAISQSWADVLQYGVTRGSELLGGM